MGRALLEHLTWPAGRSLEELLPPVSFLCGGGAYTVPRPGEAGRAAFIPESRSWARYESGSQPQSTPRLQVRGVLILCVHRASLKLLGRDTDRR